MPAEFKSRKLKVNGKAWIIKPFDGPTPPDETETMYGLCDYVQRVIWLRRNQTDAELLDTLIHEVLHAAVPHLGEREVSNAARTIAKALTTCGVVPQQSRK